LDAIPEYDGAQEVNGRRLLVIGAGPIGLAAALGGVRRGFEVTVLERDEVGASIRRWGDTRFFSPLSMNLPPGAAEVLSGRLPPDDALLTGPEFVDRVLEPLANCAELAGRVKLNHSVMAVGRSGFTRGDFAGHPIRAERRFQLLVETPQGEESMEADVVIDASGVYSLPVAIGGGGIPAPGERALSAPMIRHLGTLHANLDSLRGRRILLLGHGHSAANAVVALSRVAAEASDTRVIWATRSMNRRPCVEVASDPLPERQRIVTAANRLAAQPPEWLQVERRTRVEWIRQSSDGLQVGIGGGRVIVADDIIGLTGYRPDLSFLTELAIEIAPDTEGSARLARALANVTDCLSVPNVASSDLGSGEPGFYLAGSKSYGRARTFLLQSGYAQLQTILDTIPDRDSA
jgi:thioredoxin reductase